MSATLPAPIARVHSRIGSRFPNLSTLLFFAQLPVVAVYSRSVKHSAFSSSFFLPCNPDVFTSFQTSTFTEDKPQLLLSLGTYVCACPWIWGASVAVDSSEPGNCVPRKKGGPGADERSIMALLSLVHPVQCCSHAPWEVCMPHECGREALVDQ